LHKTGFGAKLNFKFCKGSRLILMRYPLPILSILLYCSGILVAQDSLETATPTPPDSVVTKPANEMALYWYDIRADVRLPGDTSSLDIYQEKAHKSLIYTDFSDIFRRSPLWFKYDLRENGRPAYVAGINLFPQQTAFYYNGLFMNDPIHGMYNLQFIPLPFIRSTEADLSGPTGGNLGMAHGARVNIVPNSRESDTPWTRIVYKQGRFGYSALDISFVQSFSKTFAIQLGGYNNLYDGTLITANHDAQNFRGEFIWQYTPDFYAKGQFFFNRQKIGLATYETEGTVLNPFQKENRDDYFLDLTWHPDPDHLTRLHTMIYYTTSDKELRADEGVNYAINSNFRNYGFDANFAFQYDDWEILAGGGARLPVVFGNAYTETYRPVLSNLYGSFRLPLIEGAAVQFEGVLTKHRSFTVQPGFSAMLDIKISDHRLDLKMSRSSRYPNVVDMYFNFDSLFGNPDLGVEKTLIIHGGYQYDTAVWQLGVEGGYNRISDEIRWDGSRFGNFSSRDYFYAGLHAGFGFWKIDLSGGGQYTIGDILLSPRGSAWGVLHFHDRWLKGALIVDGYLEIDYYDKHRNLRYEPRLERFYFTDGNNTAYSLLNWKILATIQEAQIFFEMNNALSQQYEVINGYDEFYYRFRLGINWEFWD